MSESSSEQMRQSMLEQTEADEWDELTPATRIELLGQKMDAIDDLDDLSEEEAQWLEEESVQAMEDLKAAFEPAIRVVKEAYEDVVKSLRPLVEMAEDIENNAE